MSEGASDSLITKFEEARNVTTNFKYLSYLIIKDNNI